VAPSTITFNSLIDSCVRSGNLERAWGILDMMREQGVAADNFTYSTLIKGIKGEEHIADLNRAFDLFETLKRESHPDEILFNVLLDACINCRQLRRALHLFEELKTQIQGAAALSPDEISFNTLIKGCAQEKQLEKAFEVFGYMKNCGLEPNDVTYNSLIDVCVRCDQMPRAWSLLGEMQENNIHPDNFTYSTLIKGIKAHSYHNGSSNQQDLERAFSLLEQMKRQSLVKPDEILYNCLIDACVRFNDLHRAVAVYNEMQMANIKPSSVTYGILIKAYGQANQVDNAFNVFSRMKESHLIPNNVTYGCLIDACVKNNHIERALQVFESMRADGLQLNTIIYTTMIKGFAKAQRLEKALEIYETMKKDDKIKPNNVTFNSLLDCCVRCNAMYRATQIF